AGRIFPSGPSWFNNGEDGIVRDLAATPGTAGTGPRPETVAEEMSAEVAMWIIVSTAPAARGDLAGSQANDNIRGKSWPAGGPAASPALRLLLALEAAWERARQRRDLATLSELELKDLGWTPTDAAAELAKPFWR
uniref:DUF1127 domain-containing protein n=1 Tax=Inquilinus sp. TaxID=1932117 RepID=UPI003784C93E